MRQLTLWASFRPDVVMPRCCSQGATIGEAENATLATALTPEHNMQTMELYGLLRHRRRPRQPPHDARYRAGVQHEQRRCGDSRNILSISGEYSHGIIPVSVLNVG